MIPHHYNPTSTDNGQEGLKVGANKVKGGERGQKVRIACSVSP